ncbi:MAG: site-2 protease family protein [Gemmatimonadaceae bacterium]
MRALSTSAEQAEAAGDATKAVSLWREVLELLPPDTKQHGAVVERVAMLGDRSANNAREVEVDRVRAKYKKHGAFVTAIAVFLAKFKFLIILLLTKGKLLLLGLTKLSTLSSMALFLGFDASFLGWPLALGLVLSIYVHEMGHVAALHRRGIKASSPMFIPGFGAFIRARQRIHGEWAEADVGLAGPLWGLGAAIVAYVVYRATGAQYWATLAGWGALINAFNLLPVWQLDGAHAFKAMSRSHRIVAAAALLGAAVLFHQRIFWLPFFGACWAIFQKPSQRADVRAVGYYVTLVGALSLLAALCRAPI